MVETKLNRFVFLFIWNQKVLVMQPFSTAAERVLSLLIAGFGDLQENSLSYYLIQNSQAVKKVCGPQKGYGEKRCEIQGGGQQMAVMVD